MKKVVSTLFFLFLFYGLGYVHTGGPIPLGAILKVAIDFLRVPYIVIAEIIIAIIALLLFFRQIIVGIFRRKAAQKAKEEDEKNYLTTLETEQSMNDANHLPVFSGVIKDK